MLLELRIAIAMVLLAILVAFGIHYNGLRKDAAQNAARGEAITQTEEVIDTDTKLEEQRVKVDVAVTQARETYYEKKSHEPTLSERDARAVPNVLRCLARERRLARERAAGVSEETGSATRAAEREDLLRRDCAE